MAAVFPVELSGGELVRDGGVATPVAIHHVLDCLAGFFRTEAEARLALRDLMQTQGLTHSQLTLLSPASTGWLRLRRRARQWSRGPHAQAQTWRADSWTAAGLGAVLGGLAGALVFPFDENMTAMAMLFVLMLATGAGAACGTVWADSLSLSVKHRKFDDVMLQQLAGGHWAVLAHDVPWTRQAAVVERVRQLSAGWCGVSSGTRWK